MSSLQLNTEVAIERLPFSIAPTDRLLFAGSCFASEIGRRFADAQFHTVVNPYGVMYNPASILHTVEKCEVADVAVLTLGTNHVYILNETGEIVDNCCKRPQRLFTERVLTVTECTGYLQQCIEKLRSFNPDVNVVLTVSPIRYRKYGFHGSQLSKASLLLATDEIVRSNAGVAYFPAYELMNDELRDYRFYKPDMLHPSEQAADYIFNRFCDAVLSDDAFRFMDEWQPIAHALNHKPFNPDSEEYKIFIEHAKERERQFRMKWKL